MTEIFVPAALIALCVSLLVWERSRIAGWRKKVPLRVCVTGTRGKSTVTRLAAAALRASGVKVAAKTTGSKPVLIFPDGRETEIRRSGLPSVLEQKRVLRWAAAVGADALVAEMMSIRAESLRVESRKILRPGILGITNVRLDHLDDMGRTKREIASTLAAAVPDDAVVFLPAVDDDPAFHAAAEKRQSEIRTVADGDSTVEFPKLEFSENIRMALAIAGRAGVDRGVALRGMAAAIPDFGEMKAWRLRAAETAFTCVSLFAANEPESSRSALDRVMERLTPKPASLVALLNFRADRGDRTRQWLDALENGWFRDFDRLVFAGDHASALARMRRWSGLDAPRVSAVGARAPEAIMDGIRPFLTRECAVVGLGNMKGVGEALVGYWSRSGEEA